MKVAVVTNRPAYYRTPIFRALGETHAVRCFFTAEGTGRWWSDLHPKDLQGLDVEESPTPHSLFIALRDGHFDYVVLGLGGRAHLLAGLAAARASGAYLVLWVDMWAYPRTLLHALGHPFVRLALRNADSVLTCGTHISRWVAKEVGRTQGIVVMPNAVDNEHFRKQLSGEVVRAMRESFDLDTSLVGCFVGRLEPEKGIDVLLHALGRTENSIGMAIVGTGREANRAVRLARDEGLEHRVRFLGWLTQDQLPILYRACDFLVVPSLTTRRFKEPWGLVTNEAMNCALPVIASDSVGAAAGGLVVDGTTGLVVPEGDSRALAEALDRLHDKSLRSTLGVHARQIVSTYTFEAAAASFEAALGAASDARRQRGAVV